MTGVLTQSTDVVIVGAGPTGLAMACELLRRGIQCRVFDRAATPAQTSRALGLQPRTLEVFENMGIVDEVLAEGVRATGATIYDRDKLLLRFRLNHLKAAPYPYVFVQPQNWTERLLTGLLHRLGGTVERSRELVDLRQDASDVTVVVRHTDEPDNVEEIRARWVVGCDGAHSRVRKLLGIAFEGSTYGEEFLLADVDLDWNRNHDETVGWLHRDGLFTALPLPGTHQWRLFADVSAPPGGEAPKASVEVFQRLMADRTGDARTTISNPTWLSNFKINRRMVDKYRVGRVFLAGDAAHIHSPFGGQGMNTGIQDVYNLAWKLALVIRGTSQENLLDTYEEERLPVAREVLEDTGRNTNLLISRNAAFRFVRDHLLLRLLSMDAVQARLVKESSQLYIHYRDSSLSSTPEAGQTRQGRVPDGASERRGLSDVLASRRALKAGDRAPDARCWRLPSRSETRLFREIRGTKFNLLLFADMMPGAGKYQALVGIARRMEAIFPEDVDTHLVVRGVDGPEGLDWDGRVLLDPNGELHRSYGVRSQALCLIRPDGYIGLSGQPAAADILVEYLGKIITAPAERARELREQDAEIPI